jgi:hypothetical protein
MNTRKQQLFDAVEVITSVVRTIHIRRTLHSVWAEPHLAFWRVIYGNLTDMAVLDWCKLFGSDDERSQPVHWNNVATDPDLFRKKLFAALGIYESKWKSYWAEVKKYRDQAVAHHNERRREIKRFPSFDLALESTYFYYDYLHAELGRIGVHEHPPDIREYSKAFAAQCRDIAEAAALATKPYREQVDRSA